MSEVDECVAAYCEHGDAEAFARVVAEYRPMVTGICRKYVIEPGDLEDAVQETFVKLANRGREIEGNVGAWLATVAGTTALDYARRSLRERARRKRLALERDDMAPMIPSWKAMETRLQEALEGLDPVMRSLVMARFFMGEAVKDMAKKSGVESSTISRRVGKAVDKVGRALKAMGCASLEETMLAGEIALGAGGLSASGSMAPLAGGKIRVGVLVSHMTTTIRVKGDLTPNFQPTEIYQLRTAPAFLGTKYQMIALVEPGTEEVGSVERGLREGNITGGMLDATDPEALKLLDVIVLGHNYAVTGRLIDAVTEAVESGVGLYNEGHVGSVLPGVRDPRVCRLMLTDRYSMHHTEGKHNIPRPATVLASHPIIGGVAVGTPVMIDGCGAVCVPMQGAKVLVEKDEPVNPMDPPMPELNGMKMPALVVGRLGKGRVALVTMRPTAPIQALPGLRGNFVHNVFQWLSEERAAWRMTNEK